MSGGRGGKIRSSLGNCPTISLFGEDLLEPIQSSQVVLALMYYLFHVEVGQLFANRLGVLWVWVAGMYVTNARS